MRRATVNGVHTILSLVTLHLCRAVMPARHLCLALLRIEAMRRQYLAPVNCATELRSRRNDEELQSSR